MSNFNMYSQYPDALAEELEVLFDNYDDAMYLVLHNMAIDRITKLLGQRESIPDPVTGKTRAGHLVFSPKARLHLTKALAQAILHEAKP
jgi:hypothetical protein